MTDYTDNFSQVNTPKKRAPKRAPRKATENYVDNKRLYTVMLKYKHACRDAEAAGLPKPRIPEYVGACIIKIAEGVSLNRNFINYPFREDMKGDGIENCIMYLHNFDPEKYKNPFAYLTQVIYYAFIRRIQKEKRQLYVKHKTLQNAALFGMLEATQGEDSSVSDSVIDLDNEYMSNLVEDFEKKLKEKKKIKKSKKSESE